MPDAIQSRVYAILEDYVSDSQELAAVQRGENFDQALSLDSIGYLELVVALELAFGLSFDVEHMQSAFHNVHSLVEHIKQHASQ